MNSLAWPDGSTDDYAGAIKLIWDNQCRHHRKVLFIQRDEGETTRGCGGRNRRIGQASSVAPAVIAPVESTCHSDVSIEWDDSKGADKHIQLRSFGTIADTGIQLGDRDDRYKRVYAQLALAACHLRVWAFTKPQTVRRIEV